MNHTPKGSQLHIGLFGKRNVGKSTLANGILRQDISIVSAVPGTTTDIVHKSIEFHPIGPVVFVDTPGIDDEGELGQMRVAKTLRALEEVDVVLWVCNDTPDTEEEVWIKRVEKRGIPIFYVVNHKDVIHEKCTMEGEKVVHLNAKDEKSIDNLREALATLLTMTKEQLCIGDHLMEGDKVLLVMPQDLQAPKGRLILPQVQIIREILDANAIPIMTTLKTLDQTLQCLIKVPKWAVTDSQVFKEVYDKLPQSVQLTSFSILMARQKGDLKHYIEGAYAALSLQSGDKVLVAESCTHNPLHGDIARDKIPKLLMKKLGFQVEFIHVTGSQFPDKLQDYRLIIQCGGCMQTRGQVIARVLKAREAGVPITNFGVLLAQLGGILDQVFLP